MSSVVSDSATAQTVVRQAPLFMGFFRQNTVVGCHFLLQVTFPMQRWYLLPPVFPALAGRFFTTEPPEVKVLVAQLCLTRCNPMDCGPPGSSVHGIFQTRILEWVVISSSSGSSWPRDQAWVSCIAGGFFTL